MSPLFSLNIALMVAVMLLLPSAKPMTLFNLPLIDIKNNISNEQITGSYILELLFAIKSQSAFSQVDADDFVLTPDFSLDSSLKYIVATLMRRIVSCDAQIFFNQIRLVLFRYYRTQPSKGHYS